jgi:hypothetical protein
MNKAHRLFAPRAGRKTSAPGKAAENRVEPIAMKLAEDLGQDPEAAERNAQSIAAVLRRALRRRKAGRAGPGKAPS